MITFNRKLNETIMIDDEISVTILNIEGDQVKVGVEAPKYIEIYKEEIYHLLNPEAHMNADDVATASD